MLGPYLILLSLGCILAGKFDIMLNEENEDLELLLQEVVIRTFEPYKCIIIITDSFYSDLFNKSWFKRFGSVITFLMIIVEEHEDLYAPSNFTQSTLLLAKNQGCQLYIVLLMNGIQVSRLLRFGDRYREINTLSKYIFLYDNRLFDKTLFYIWKRIINVIFLRKFELKGVLSGNRTSSRYEITTVPFPVPINEILIPWRLDIWAKSTFVKGVNLFRDKTWDLLNQTLKIAGFSHTPGVAISNRSLSSNRASIKNTMDNDTYFYGTEIEILQTISKAMNFRSAIYTPENVEVELWGRKIFGGKYTGIIGEMSQSISDIALGDLYNTPYLLDLMDLTIPYNTECLTFLTPEALTDNSWKTLILPFGPLMWTGVLICLVICILAFHYFARFHNSVTYPKTIESHKPVKSEQHTTILLIYPEIYKLDSNMKYTLMREKYQVSKKDAEVTGLYQFLEPVNSALYTYSMLLLVSLPKLPTGWSLRVLTGWNWLYCLLVVTSYRASMTAILARPTPKVTIDTLDELVSSKLTYGGWGEINKEFFKASFDQTIQMISDNFILVNNSEEAVEKVAQASFAFYENTYFLKEAIVKQQNSVKFRDTNNTNTTTYKSRTSQKENRNLHIMNDCIIIVPVSLGLQKNSPIKPRIDKIIRRVIEAGLIKKWIDDVMQNIMHTLMQKDNKNTKALMNMKKFSGAFVALVIGYFLSIIMLLCEISYFHYFTMKNPHYNKYSRQIEINQNL